ncbi:hypothetical protein [Plantactinospora soyae]|uniref:Phage holin family protein n=1 Tax=Plantactinospora soyae TaxID=1544732 RepID=A0A927LZ46_9ACTN|nr:hypothetical protein [Plantactinospora soyae]MBE1485167.1 hypothetical protein [Plantactinospora soyae]
MTEEAQPPAVDRAAGQAPETPPGPAPRYLEPSYALPTDSVSGNPAEQTSTAGVDRPGQPSEWARPGWDGSAGAATPGSDGVPTAVPLYGAAPVSAPAPVSGATPTAFGGTPYPVTEAPAQAAVPGAYLSPAGAGPRPAYPGAPGAGERPPLVPAPPRDSVRAPRRVDAVPGTPFGLVYLDVAPVTSGPAVGALVTGIGSILVAFGAGCMGLIGLNGGWGGWAAGAFAVLAGLLGTVGVLLGELGRRQTRTTGAAVRPGQARRPLAWPPVAEGAPPVRYTGHGLAMAGLICGGVGLALTVLALAISVLLQVA